MLVDFELLILDLVERFRYLSIFLLCIFTGLIFNLKLRKVEKKEVIKFSDTLVYFGTAGIYDCK